MSGWIALRLVKFLALAALAAGLALAAGQPAQAARARAAFWLAAPAWWATTLAGFLLVRISGRSLGEPFVGLGILASLVAVHGAVLCASPHPSRVARALPLAGLGAAVAAMVARDLELPVLVGLTLGGGALGAALARLFSPVDGVSAANAAEEARAWFVALARAEGLSLVLLMAISMPLRRALGISLDHGTGAIGWAHGALFLLYVQAWSVARRPLGWSAGTAGLALVAALVPFGTFAFERWALAATPAAGPPRAR